ALLAGCWPWPVRSRAFYPRAALTDGNDPKVTAGDEFVFERCRGIFTHPMLSGHCIYLVVAHDRVVENAKLFFPSADTHAALKGVGGLGRDAPAVRAPTGWIYIRQVRPDRIVADVDVAGVAADGETVFVRDRVTFKLTRVGAEPFLDF
ncbi:MAG TPA: hypothetical protein VJT67_10290, partial [Longimicrobiaceae bacterium]|nr:hypothetical protein [Longimicrobiaceae bacterium]